MGPNIFFKSAPSGNQNSSGIYLGSMMVSSGVKFVPDRKQAHAPRSITLNSGETFTLASTRLCGLARCTTPRGWSETLQQLRNRLLRDFELHRRVSERDVLAP